MTAPSGASRGEGRRERRAPRSQDPEHTRKVMRANRSRDTEPELLLRRELHWRGVRYRLHASDLPGRPDLVIRRLEAGRVRRRRLLARQPLAPAGLSCLEEDIASNHGYWVPKVRGNIERDRRVDATLDAAGWSVVRIWESDVRRDPRAAADRVERAIRAADAARAP